MSEIRAGLPGASIVLGVSGGIAAYKAADLTSKLVQAGANVQVLMTGGARQFIAPMTFQALTRNSVYTSVFEGWEGDSAGHVTVAAEADAVLVAPATANTIARFAHGRTDDMLGAVVLATEAPVIVAPAMEHHMWHHPATQENVAILRRRGLTFVEPESGHLASGAEGDGRLATVDRLIGNLRAVLGRSGPLAGSIVVVTAGGTQEAIDPVRYVGNHSSGKMGVAIAEAAIDAGAQVILIAGPTVKDVPVMAEVRRVQSALEMQRAVHDALSGADVLIMAAAVADFRPASPQAQKIKKEPGTETMTIEMTKNPDIIAGIDGDAVLKVGFAAETTSLLEHAEAKLRGKGLNMIVANDATATLGSERVTATLLYADERDPRTLYDLTKVDFARELIAEVAGLRMGRGA